MLAKQKFDWHIDPLMLASQLNKVSNFLDDPILTRKSYAKPLIHYFEEEAKKLSQEIISK